MTSATMKPAEVMMTEPEDQSSRQRALDPTASFIVQAPAGSGKTGLLVRRFLRLLATVDAPEQILAITFTRKAAAEMRQRIVLALRGLDSKGVPEKDEATLMLAKGAEARDGELGWNLVGNPRRLRVQTIDSFCQELVRRMPWSARFGGVPAPLEDPEPVYLEAADETLALIEDQQQPTLAAACARVLQLVDANRGQAQLLLAELLQGRDRWMNVLGNHGRGQFEGWWRQTIDDTLTECNDLLDNQLRQSLGRVATLAAIEVLKPENNARENTVSVLEPWNGFVGFPAPQSDQVQRWRGLAHLLLTDKGAVRSPRGINKTIGIVPGDKENKQRLVDLLEQLSDQPDLHRAWQRISILPDPAMRDAEWENIDAIVSLLPVAAAQLRLRFNDLHGADFTEISQRADLALGSGDDPSDLNLALDYQLRHILMDEFQDTSSGQIELLRKLLAGWEKGDGRSLFLVGDPMQSIYRFREAEVGIFMDVQDNGIDDLQPEQLTLTANFRSTAELVDWFNQSFRQVMPDRRSIVHGAVEYTPASAFHAADAYSGVFVHAAIRRDSVTEAVAVVDCIEQTLAHPTGGDIAVLGRSRGHLADIVQELNRRQIGFQGIKLQHLGERQGVQDLLAVLRVLVQPADDVAWLGLLRAPWGGASLKDLITLVGEGGQTAVAAALQDELALDGLSEDSRIRMENVRNVIDQGLADRARLPLHRNLEACWLRLGGPATVESEDLDNCRQLIRLVKTMEAENLAIHAESLDAAMAELYAEHHVEERVKLMTIHGAKGLEFDSVILPGLQRTSRSDGKPLLRWKRLPDRLLIAPRPWSDAASPIYDYLTELEKEHQRNERSRLLYVACTRARRRLHLFGSANPDKKGVSPSLPASTSLLSLLWPAVVDDFQGAMDQWTEPGPNDEPIPDVVPSQLHRLHPGWSVPPLPAPVPQPAATAAETGEAEPIEFDWARESTRIAGIVIHEELQSVDKVGWSVWREREFTPNDQARWRRRLGENGLAVSQIAAAVAQVDTALSRTVADDQAAWVFAESHADIRTEWALTGVERGAIRHVVLDRAFVDENGVRWVIDFKSGRHEDDTTLAAFLAEEKARYRVIMERYACILSALESRTVRAALYYPMLGQLLTY